MRAEAEDKKSGYSCRPGEEQATAADGRNE